MSKFQRELLQGRLAELDRLLAENELRSKQYAPDTFAEQECRSEHSELIADRRKVELALRDLDQPRDGLDARQRAIVESEVARRRIQIETFAAQLEREGDYRQARIHRGQIPGLREAIIREFGWHVRRVA